MYYCFDCGLYFEIPETSYETHNLSEPPFELLLLCPNCKSNNFDEKKSTHCMCCGAKLLNGEKDYCSNECRLKGNEMWRKEQRRRKLKKSNKINNLALEIEMYNKSHKTCYTYGYYTTYIMPKIKEGDKNV